MAKKMKNRTRQQKQRGFFSEPIFLIALAIIASFALAAPPANFPESAAITDQQIYDMTTQFQHLRFLLDQEIAFDLNRQISPPGCSPILPTTIDLSPFLAEFNDKTDLTCILNDSTPSFSNETEFSLVVNCEHDFTGTSMTKTMTFQKKVGFGANPTSSNCCTFVTDRQADQNDLDICATSPTGPGTSGTCVIYATPDQLGPNQSTDIKIYAQGFHNLPPGGLIGTVPLDCGNFITTAACSGTVCSGTCGASPNFYSSILPSQEYTINASLMDELQTVVCVPDTVTVNAPPVSETIAYWKLDEPVQPYNDFSGAGHVLQRTNVTTEIGTGAVSNSAYFNGFIIDPPFSNGNSCSYGTGNNAYTATSATQADPNPIALNNRSFSISFWLKAKNRLQANQTIFSQCQEAANKKCLKIRVESVGPSPLCNPDKNSFLIIETEPTALPTSPNRIDSMSDLNITDNNWMHVAITFSRTDSSTGTANIYLNGSLKKTKTNFGTYLGTGNRTCLGAFCGPSSVGEHFIGNLDEFLIVNRELNAGEVDTLFQQTHPQDPPSEWSQWQFEQLLGIQHRNEFSGLFDLTGLFQTPIGRVNKGIEQKSGGTATGGHGPSLDLAGASFSVSAWIKPNAEIQDIGTNYTIFSQCGALAINDATGFNCFINTPCYYSLQTNKCLNLEYRPGYNSLNFDLGRNFAKTNDDSIPRNLWSHVAFVFNGQTKTRSVFINGNLVPFSSSPAVSKQKYEGGASTSCIGIQCLTGTWPAQHPFIGKLDNVSVYRRILSLAEITAMASQGNQSIAAPLFADWNFNQLTANKFSDFSGNGFSLENLGGQSSAGLIGNALDLNNFSTNDTKFAISPDINFGGDTDFSISFWVKPRNSRNLNDSVIFSQCPDPTYFYAVGATSFGKQCMTVSLRPTGSNTKITWQFEETSYNSTNALLSTDGGKTIVPFNGWTHLGFTYTHGTRVRKIFVNGVLVGSDSAGGSNPRPYRVGGGSICFGRVCNQVPVAVGGILGFSGDLYFNGLFDEFKLWNKTLTDSEVQQQYNADIAVGNPPRLLKRYSFEETGTGNFKDMVSQNFDLSRFNGVETRATAGVTGAANYAYFPGIGNPGPYLLGEPLDLAGQKYSISMWVKPDSGVFSDQELFSLCNNPSNPNGYHTNDCREFILRNQSIIINYKDRFVSLNNAVFANEWQLVTFAFDNSNPLLPQFKVYKRKIGDASLTEYNSTTNPALADVPPLESEPTRFCIGAKCSAENNYNPDPGTYYKGAMDELRIYNKALTTTEITQLFNSPAN